MADREKTGDAQLDDMVEQYEYDKTNFQDIRSQAATDMRYVSGDPWDQVDKDLRGEDRPTVAPEEMSQYRNQVVNALMQNPRGAKFSPSGNGANDRGAEFYQNKWREIEYRSHAPMQYSMVADHVLQRSFGFLRIRTDYPSPRAANQDLFLEAFADPDICLPDTDCMTLDGSGSTRFGVHEWVDKSEFKRLYQHARPVNVSDYTKGAASWVQGSKVLRLELWRLESTPKKLVLIQPRAPLARPMPGAMLGLQQAPAPKPIQAFEDEIPDLKRRFPQGLDLLRELRTVDYPKVKQYFTNGLEILDESEWAGIHIPFVYCFGKVLYVPEGGQSKKVILSMTRFGRDPWKSYCYACSQQLEVLGMVPKAPLMAVAGQFADYEQDVEEIFYSPKAYLYYHAKTEATGDAILGPPIPVDYPVGQHLQALELVKEGFRRAIQAAMGSNFLPTQAQRMNDKSGEALKKIDDVATQGTYHFVYAYDSMIRRAAVIGEDLMTPILGYAGETAVRTPDEKAQIVNINQPGAKDAYETDGEYGVTISTGPSSDSVRDAGEEFLQTLVGGQSLAQLMQIVGPQKTAAMLAIAIRMREPQLGPMAATLADLIEPAEFKSNDGKPPDPRLVAAQSQIQQLHQELQKLGMVIQTKQIEGQAKYEIAKLQTTATSQDKAADREVKLFQALSTAKNDELALFLEESRLVGERSLKAIEALHSELRQARESNAQRAHEQRLQIRDHAEAGRQRTHEAGMAAGDAAVAQAEGERQRVHDGNEAAAQRATVVTENAADRAAAAAQEPPVGGGGA